jgi:hypothetical protein
MRTITLATIGYMAPSDVFSLQQELACLSFYS